MLGILQTARRFSPERGSFRPYARTYANGSQHEQRNCYECEHRKANQNPELVGEGMHGVVYNHFKDSTIITASLNGTLPVQPAGSSLSE
jgi:hypothetical protein